MKNIQTFELSNSAFSKVDESIYTDGEHFYMGVAFEQEPDLGEGASSVDISQYPLEDVLDKFGVYVSDFCEDINSKKSKQRKLVLAGTTINDVQELKSIIGRHVYNSISKCRGIESVELVIE